MIEDHHFKWSSQSICVSAFSRDQTQILCVLKQVCYPLDHSGRFVPSIKGISVILRMCDLLNVYIHISKVLSFYFFFYYYFFIFQKVSYTNFNNTLTMKEGQRENTSIFK